MRAMTTTLFCAALLFVSACDEESTGPNAGVDLKVAGIIIPFATELAQNVTAPVTVELYNNGTASIAAGYDTTVSFFDDAAFTTTAWADVTITNGPALAPGESQEISGTFVVTAGAPPQLVYCVVNADAGAVTGDLYLDNNLALKVIQVLGEGAVPPLPIELPDITLSSTTVPAEIQRPGTFEFDVIVRNAGSTTTSAAFDVLVEAYQDESYTIERWSAQQPVTDTIAAGLGAGDTATATISFTVAETDPLGAVYLVITLDDGNTVSEGNESNNIFYRESEVVLEQKPNLTVTIDSATSVYQLGGSSNIAVTYTITNTGPEDCNGSVAELELREQGSGNLVVSFGTAGIPALASGEDHSVTESGLSVSSVPGGYTDYDIVAVADIGGNIDERDETDNEAVSSILIYQPSEPDLEVTELTVTPTINLGDNIAVTYEISNTGADSSGSTSFVFMYLKDSAVGGNTIASWFYQVPVLGIGASYSDAVLVNPVGLSAGNTYYLSIEADGADQVLEINEANNGSAAEPVVVN